MGTLYHGSSVSGLKKLEPRKSTHGTYVYATKYEELAVLFMRKCGDDLTYTLYRDNQDGPWKLIERVPNAFKTMYSNESSLYTVPDITFEDIHTGFSELVSTSEVETLSETRIPNVYDKVKELESSGKVEIYRFSNRPNVIPKDDSDLVMNQIKQNERNHKRLTKSSFKRLLFLHPNALETINKELAKVGEKPFDTNDIVDIFEEFLVRQMLNPSHEQFIESSYLMISKSYPSLEPVIKSKLDILNNSKNEKISFILDTIYKRFKDFPKEKFDDIKNYYLNSNKSYEDICKEINNQVVRISMMESLISKDIPSDVLSNSIIFIGPMGSLKSSTSSVMSTILNMPKVSLDDRETLKEYYDKRSEFEDFKDFEFYLSSSVLTNLKVPAIIDFGAGHSVYEDPIMFYEFQKLMSRFSNVVYMIPSLDKEESIQILNERILERNPNESPETFNANRHFVNMPCNEEVSTIREVTGSKDIQEICDEVISKIQNKEYKNSYIEEEQHKI